MKTMKGQHPIDLVITWVNGSDPNWIMEKETHRTKELHFFEKNNSLGASEVRYRDWENLEFLFRGIEQFMPWVRKIHFVTCGHLPKWLNSKHPKLHIVNHSDYIPKKYLPTFSSHPIELNFHRIQGLSEHFVYFNDDVFVTNRTQPSDFFVNGLPLDAAIQNNITSINYHDPFWHILLNNVSIINKNFEKRVVISHNMSKWFNMAYFPIGLFKNIILAPYSNFTGFYNYHLPSALTKSTFVELWTKEKEILENVSATKFRSRTDVNQYLIQDWQKVSGKFHPTNLHRQGKKYDITKANLQIIHKAITHQKYKTLCLNDCAFEADFELCKRTIINSFNKILPEKSTFEISPILGSAEMEYSHE